MPELTTSRWFAYSRLAGYRLALVKVASWGDPAVDMTAIRWLIAFITGAVSTKRLPACLGEFVFRFNRRPPSASATARWPDQSVVEIAPHTC